MVPQRLIRRTALIAYRSSFFGLSEKLKTLQRMLTETWSTGPAVNLIVLSPGIGLPVLSNLNIDSGRHPAPMGITGLLLLAIGLIRLTASMLQSRTQVIACDSGSGQPLCCLAESFGMRTANLPVPSAAGPRRWIWRAWWRVSRMVFTPVVWLRHSFQFALQPATFEAIALTTSG